jgi:hypothetical protein
MSVGAARAGGSVPRAVASGSPTTEDSLATARGTDPVGAAQASESAPRAVASGSLKTDGAPATAQGADRIEKIKAANAAAENYGNFYGQNLSPVQPGILLVYGVMQGLGLTVGVWDLVRYTIPIFVASIILAIIQFSWLDRALGRMSEAKR